MASQIEPAGRVLGCDRSHRLLRTLNERNSAMPVQADVLRLPFADGRFDRCRADRLLQHVANPQDAVNELVRVTKTSGIVLICDTDWDTLVIDHPRKDVTRAVARHFCDTVTSGTVGRALPRFLAQAGLKDVQVEGLALTFQDALTADQAIGIRQAGLLAAEDGIVDLETIVDWMLDIEHADAAGQFFASVTGFASHGKK